MATAAELVDALKLELRARRVTYAQLAGALALSEASVKRMFSLRRMSIDRLDAVLATIGVELSDLVRRCEESRHRLTHLTEAQERELVADPRRLLVAVSVKNHWTFDELMREYAFSEPECIRLLAHLDRIGLIDLLPGNRFRLRFDEDFRWLPGGPIETFFERTLVGEFLQGDFSAPGRAELFLDGWLTEVGRGAVLSRLEDLADAFRAELARSCTYPVRERRHVGLLVAFRPCTFSTFAPYRRNDGGQPAPPRARVRRESGAGAAQRQSRRDKA